MDQLNYSPWNVVVLFDEEVTSEFIKLNRIIIAKVPSKIILNLTDVQPHMTLYTTNYPTQNLSEIIECLSKTVNTFHSFSIKFSTKVIDMNSIFINADPNMVLIQLHSKIVDALNPLRGGLYDEKELGLIGNNSERKNSLLTYGMWAAKELYVPHVSIARPFDVGLCNSALECLPKKINIDAKVNKIGLVERGPDGTCKKVLQTYSLKK